MGICLATSPRDAQNFHRFCNNSVMLHGCAINSLFRMSMQRCYVRAYCLDVEFNASNQPIQTCKMVCVRVVLLSLRTTERGLHLKRVIVAERLDSLHMLQII